MESFEQFIAKYPSETFEKGQTILLRDVTPKAVYVIEAGLVRTYIITTSGDERLVALDSIGEDLPIGYALGLIERAQYFYEAYSRCVIRFVPREKYAHYLRTNVDSLWQRHARFTRLLLATFARIDALEQPRASDKIASTLLYMADQIGIRLYPYRTRRRLRITQQEIAESLGLTRETTGLALKKLELKNILTHSRNNYILYTERLRKYIDDRKR